jgi:uncharacterized protein YdbL (DUF1318 family)
MKRLILSICFLAALGGAALAAGAYDLKEMTPTVKAALEGRKARYAELKSLKAQVAVGETNRGYVFAIGTVPGVSDVVNAENTDRKVIYQAIVEQNGLGDSDLMTVEKAFAKVQRDKAASGEKIQDEDGTWTVK